MKLSLWGVAAEPHPSLARARGWPVAAWPVAGWLVCLALAQPAWAQTAPNQNMRPGLSVADPESASTLPDWRPFQPSASASPELPATLDEAIRRWQAANRAVGEFPRGHVDLLRWEAQQPPDGAASAAGTPGPAPQPLGWTEVWSQIQRQHADRVLPPQANAIETLHARQGWLALERQARQAWVQASTAQALLRLQHERVHAARTAHALGERMTGLGHWSRARFIPVQQTLAREQASLLQARSNARQTLEALAGLMGLWQGDAVQTLAQRLPVSLPEPERIQPSANAEGHALARRPDLLWQRDVAARQQSSVSETQWSRWHQELHDSVSRSRSNSVSDPFPETVPQWPSSPLRHDTALTQALDSQTAVQRDALRLRSRVRLAWDQLQAAQALDNLQHKQLLPLAQTAEAETLLRYNGMLQSTWELIDAARTRLGAEAEALNARQTHWLAHIDWLTLMAGGDIDPPASGSSNNSGSADSAPQGH